MAAPDVYRHFDHSHYSGPFVYDHIPSPDLSYPTYEAAIRCRGSNNRSVVTPEQKRPWSSTRDRNWQQREDFMSDRPSEQGQSERPTRAVNDGSSRVPITSSPSSHAVARTAPGHRSVTSPTSQRQSQHAGRTFELPPLSQLPTSTGGSFSPSATRIGGVSSILNPLHAEDVQEPRRRKASQLDSPHSFGQVLPSIGTGLYGPQPSSALPAPSPVPQYVAPSERAPRRILTPRSPSLHRAASLGQLNPNAGTISAQRTPFPTSPRARTYTVEPGTAGAPPLPNTIPGDRIQYGVPAPSPSSEAARRANMVGPRARGYSSSASPSTSYSSYSQAGQTSPGAQYVPTSMPTLSAPYTASGDGSTGAPTNTPGPERQRPMGIPISSSGGQNVYQMMTIETTSGAVSLPVDVQAASRVADEKRRRNAGASARFRQRRKEKEREASTTISRLEQQVKELGEDADFYRRERDFLAGILAHVPGGERHLSRPTSPRHRRSSVVIGAGPGVSGNMGYAPTQEPAPRSPGEGRNVRRRTSTFSLPPPGPQSQLPSSGYLTPQSYGQLAPQPPPALQQTPSGAFPSPATPMLAGQGGQHQQHPPLGPPTVLQTLPQPGPINPYASERRPPGPPGQSRDGR